MADATVVHADATAVTMIGALPTRLRAMAARAAARDRRADELVDVLDGGAAPQPLCGREVAAEVVAAGSAGSAGQEAARSWRTYRRPVRTRAAM